MRIPVAPMGAVRMTKRGKFVSATAQRYISYKQHIGFHLRRTHDKPTKFAVSISATFHMPIPQSWSKKKQQEAIGKPHMVKPDIDNLLKGLFDSCNGIVWEDDNQVVEVMNVTKVYSDEPGIEFQYKPLF